MKFLFFVNFYLLVSTVGFSQKAKEEATLKEMVSKKFMWMINKNYDSLESILHDRMTYIHSNGWSQNKTELIEDLRSGKFSLTDVQIQALAVKIGNQTALVNGQGKFVGAINGVAFSVDLIFNEGYVKESSNWRLISRLATKVSQ